MSSAYNKQHVASSNFQRITYITQKVLIHAGFIGWLQYDIILFFSIKLID